MNLYFTFKKVVKKSNSKKKYEYGYVILNYTNNSQRLELSTKVKCLEKDFIKDNLFPIQNTDLEHLNKNELLNNFKGNVEKIIFSIKNDNHLPTTSLVKVKVHQFQSKIFKESILNSNRNLPVLMVLKEKYIPILDTETSYFRSIKYRLGLVEDFIKLNYNSSLSFDEIDYEFYRELEKYLVSKNLFNSTTSKIISQFRQFLMFTIREKYTDKVITDYVVKLPKGKKFNVNTLNVEQIKELITFRKFDYYEKINKEEIQTFQQYYLDWRQKDYLIEDNLLGLKNPQKQYYTTYEVIKDLFLFSISTSLRWSDCVRIKIDDFNFDTLQFNILQKKTHDEINLDENDISKWIFKKYSKNKEKQQFLFPLNCLNNEKSRNNYLVKVNKHLKEIGKILKFNNYTTQTKRIGKSPFKVPSVPIHNHISFHMGRRTHIDFLVKEGIDLRTVSLNVGHKSLSMTTLYIDKDSKKIKTAFDNLKPNQLESISKNNNIDLKNKSNPIEQLKMDLKRDFENKIITEDYYFRKLDEIYLGKI